jgi:hypothetical protein
MLPMVEAGESGPMLAGSVDVRLPTGDASNFQTERSASRFSLDRVLQRKGDSLRFRRDDASVFGHFLSHIGKSWSVFRRLTRRSQTLL